MRTRCTATHKPRLIPHARRTARLSRYGGSRRCWHERTRIHLRQRGFSNECTSCSGFTRQGNRLAHLPVLVQPLVRGATVLPASLSLARTARPTYRLLNDAWRFGYILVPLHQIQRIRQGHVDALLAKASQHPWRARSARHRARVPPNHSLHPGPATAAGVSLVRASGSIVTYQAYTARLHGPGELER